MTKKQKMIQRKNIRNYLPKYDLGTSLDNTLTGPYLMALQIGQGVADKGRQTGNQYITTARQDELGANLSGKAGAYDRAKIGSIVNAVTDPVTSVASNLSNLGTTAATSGVASTIGSGISSTIGSSLVNSATHALPLTLLSLLSGIPISTLISTTPTSLSSSATGSVTSGASSGAASGASSAGSSVAGALGVVAGLGALGKGIYDAFTVADLFDRPAISDSEFNEMQGEQTLSGIHGVQYKQKTGVNMSDAAQIGAAKEGADIAAAANAGMGLGAGVGGTTAGILGLAGALSSVPVLGWLLGPIVAAVGAGLGAGIGAGSADASAEAVAQAQQVNNAVERWNTHEAAVANSQGIRELYDQRKQKLHGNAAADTANLAVVTADKGKPPYGVTSYKFLPRMYGDVATPNGIQKGDVNAIIGKGEVAANLHEETAFNINFGKSGDQENVKAHLKNSDIILSNNPKMIIPGTEELVEGGLTPAKAGRESAERIYQINKAVEKDSKNRDLHTLKFLQELAHKAKLPYLLNLASITSILNYMLKNKEYKNGIEHAQNGRSPYNILPHYSLGNALLQYGLPTIGGLGTLIGNAIMYADIANEEVAPAPQLHVSNADAQRAISQMKSSYNADPELAAARTINRLLNYANRHNGYTPGLRMAMDQAAYANYASLVQKILADKLNKSVALHNDKQKTLASLKDADAARAGAAKSESSKIYRSEQANHRRDKYGVGSALYTNFQNFSLNTSNAILSGKMLKLVSDELDLKKKLRTTGNEQNKPAILQTPVFANMFNIPQYDYFGLTPLINAATPYQVWSMVNKRKSTPRSNIYVAPWNS